MPEAVAGSLVLGFSGSRVLWFRCWIDVCGRRAIVAFERGRLIPAAAWLADYRARSLRPDLVAGLTLAAYLLPAGIGDASLAGLPPEAGLYACLFSGLVFWIFCSSKHTVITVTSALSLLIGASVGELSGGDPARHAALAAGVTLLVALMAFAAWLIRAGNAVGFFSETVLVGFKAGLAFYLASTQLPKLFGFKGAHGDFWENSAYFLAHLGETHAMALLVGVVALSVLVAGKFWLKNRPVAFVVVIGGIATARLLDLQARGVSLLGPVPQGLPSLGLPHVNRHDLNQLLPIGIACFVLAAVETSAIGRMFGQKHGHRFNANRELLAIGASNLLSGLGRGFPVSGGMSQSLVNESAGARTPLSGAVAALFTLIVVLFASGLLRNLPQPVLADEPRRGCGLSTYLALQPHRVHGGHRSVPWGSRIRTRERGAPRRGDFDRAAAAASGTPAGDRAHARAR
jgi:SulP family sulfate permease